MTRKRINKHTVAHIALQLIVISLFGVAPWIVIGMSGVNENKGNGVIGGLLLLPAIISAAIIFSYSMRISIARKKLKLFYRVTAIFPLVALLITLVIPH